MSAILKTPMIQTMLAEMSTAQVSSMLAMMDTDQVPTDYTIGMASGGIPTTLATNPSFVTISMKQFYVMKTTADTPDTADLRKETKKVTGALYQPTAGTPNYSFIEFGQDICRFWAFINGQALIVPETLSTVELRAEVLKRELENFSTAISCDAQGNVGIDGNLQVNGNVEILGNVKSDSYGRKVNISLLDNEYLTAELIKFPDGSDYFAYEVGKTLHIHARIKLTAKENLQKGNQYGVGIFSYSDDGSRISMKASYKGSVLEALTIGDLEWNGSNQYLPNYFIQTNADFNFFMASDILVGNSVYFDFNQVINL